MRGRVSFLEDEFYNELKKIKNRTGLPMTRIQKIINQNMLKKHDDDYWKTFPKQEKFKKKGRRKRNVW